MTAPAMPVLLCASPACAGKTCGRDLHAFGYARGEYRYLRCRTHRACQEFELDELAALDVQARPVEGGDSGVIPSSAVETPCSGQPAGPGPEDSPAGAADAAAGVAPRQPEHDLPGTDTAPVPGAEAAAPPADGQPAAEVDGPASAAGQLLYQGRTWWCPTCLQGRELPSKRCCRTPLIEADTIIRRRVADADQL